MCPRNILYAVFLLASSLILIQADEYDYEHQAKWYDSFKECSLERQSPIELISDEVRKLRYSLIIGEAPRWNFAQISYDMPAISFVLYDTPYIQAAKCENNGHTINIQLPKPKVERLWQIHDKLSPHIMGGPLPSAARYIAESVHFHWGSQDAHGSEHVIDARRFAMEMHIVHRNSNYSTIEEAREHADGLAVIAVLFQVDQTLETDFVGLNNIITALEKVAKFNESFEIANLTLANLFSDLDTTEFFTYEGSLTTPPCSQAVTWLIFSHTIKLSPEQMARFHHISDAHDSMLENNYRSLQAKGNRKVYLRKVQKETSNQNPAEALTIPEIEDFA